MAPRRAIVAPSWLQTRGESPPYPVARGTAIMRFLAFVVLTAALAVQAPAQIVTKTARFTVPSTPTTFFAGQQGVLSFTYDEGGVNQQSALMFVPLTDFALVIDTPFGGTQTLAFGDGGQNGAQFEFGQYNGTDWFSTSFAPPSAPNIFSVSFQVGANGPDFGSFLLIDNAFDAVDVEYDAPVAAIGGGCALAGLEEPFLGNLNLTQSPGSADVFVQRGPASGLGLLAIGTLPLPTPVVLPLGTPGCELFVVPEVIVTLLLDASGQTSFSLPIPSGFGGNSLYYQLFAFDTLGNFYGTPGIELNIL